MSLWKRHPVEAELLAELIERVPSFAHLTLDQARAICIDRCIRAISRQTRGGAKPDLDPSLGWIAEHLGVFHSFVEISIDRAKKGPRPT